ncbi:FtsX-like permease family protein [Actinomyces sp.]|uniref:FtsX-like permease family protein n=1 Tax=Actinomyces sp. TaxID=29317 RepID=UPI0026DACC58|nr:FtsX-like permease family protein [Actinomyces sp.]MDO4899582.1 FtsX-like permease family protein [Actinomyces sp.]
MLREHRASYMGVGAVVLVTSVLVGSEALLFQASRLSAVEVSAMSPPQAVFFLGRIYSGHLTAIGQLAIVGMAGVILVAQAMSVAVQGRRRELALLRLAGATSWRIRRMIAREAFLLGLGCSSLGALVSILGLRALARLLASQDNWAEDYIPRITASGLLLTVAVMTVVTTAGALIGARGAARTPALEAARESSTVMRGVGRVRWAATAICAALVVWIWVAGPAHLPWDADDGVALWIGAAVAVGLCALAPALVDIAVRVFCLPLQALDPGASLTAWAHTRMSARRAAAVVVPVVAVVTLATVPVMASSLGSGRDYQDDYALPGQVDVTLHQESEQLDPELETAWENTVASREAATAVRAKTSARSWMVAPAEQTPAQIIERARRESFPMGTLSTYQVTVTTASDPGALITAAGLHLVEGNAEDVHGTDVAVRADRIREDGSSYQLGDSLTLLGNNGDETRLRVVARFDNSGYPLITSLVADENVLSAATGDPVTEDWFLTAFSGGQDELLQTLSRTAPATATVTTGQGWTDNIVAAETKRGASNDATMTGGICLLATGVMVQQVFALIRSRCRESRLLHRTGASRSTVLRSALAQTAGLQLLGLAIAGVSIAVTWVWLAQALVPYYSDLTVPPAVPWAFLIASSIAALLVPQLTALVTTLRSTRSAVPASERGART